MRKNTIETTDSPASGTDSRNAINDNALNDAIIEAAEKRLTSRRMEKMRSVLSKRQPDLTLVLSNIHDPHNVSAIYRSCDAFGVREVHLHYTRTAFPVLGRKSSASARKWVDSARHRTAAEMLDKLRSRNFQILSTSFTPRAKSLWEWNFLGPTAIILGNEHDGVEEELLAASDGEIYIPMRGMIQSLNVSVAAAVILAEAARQRALAGMYASPRLSGDEFKAALADWLER